MTPNLKAFLDMIARAEIGKELLAKSDNGYNIVVGSRPSMPILFGSYHDHPRLTVEYARGKKSTAAGRYQILMRNYDAYKRILGLPDFSPASQDAIAIRLIGECEAIKLIESGQIERAIANCRSRWASFPGAGYGQNEHEMAALIAAYTQAGGNLA